MTSQTEHEKLRKRLEAILEIKSSKYIGTQEAFNIVKRVERIRSYPAEAADKINEHIKELSLLTYPATCERIIGIGSYINFFSRLFDMLSHKRDKNPLVDGILNYSWYLANAASNQKRGFYSNIFLLFPLNMQAYFDFEEVESKIDSLSLESITKAIVPFFADANSNKIAADLEFSESVNEVINKGYDELKSSIRDRELGDKIANYFNEIERIISPNWDEDSLRKIFMLEEARAIKLAYSSFDLAKIAQRLKRDKVDNRKEYRRMLLTEWAEKAECTDYESAILNIEKRIETRKKRLEGILAMAQGEKIILAEEVKKWIEFAEFMKEIIKEEQNFLDRFYELGER